MEEDAGEEKKATFLIDRLQNAFATQEEKEIAECISEIKVSNDNNSQICAHSSDPSYLLYNFAELTPRSIH